MLYTTQELYNNLTNRELDLFDLREKATFTALFYLLTNNKVRLTKNDTSKHNYIIKSGLLKSTKLENQIDAGTIKFNTDFTLEEIEKICALEKILERNCTEETKLQRDILIRSMAVYAYSKDKIASHVNSVKPYYTANSIRYSGFYNVAKKCVGQFEKNCKKIEDAYLSLESQPE